ncbi:MAG: ATP-dependent DNA helicase RecG [Lachnospiraceae bacterium]|nr:ATP-dependent DNA helicase RecG [Lachnospiraceae bacterium]
MTELTKLKGIGPKTAALFDKLGIRSCEDLIGTYPVHYDAYEPPIKIGEAADGMTCAILGRITGNVSFFTSARNLKIVSTVIRDETGSLKLTWYNMPYVRQRLIKGSFLVFRGVIRASRNGLTMDHPEIFAPGIYDNKVKTLTPVYGLTKGLSNNAFGKAVAGAMELVERREDYLPSTYRQLYGLRPEWEAVQAIHFPKNQEDLVAARRRIAFDEFFLFILALRLLRRKTDETEEAYVFEKSWETENILERLPYDLTKAQLRAWHEIENDLTGGRRMARLLQGDVGSGKTIVSFLALALAVENGCQGALMAPTEVLARQHYENLCHLTEAGILPSLRPVLLVSSMGAAAAREAREAIASGEAGVVIGTHALIQNKVSYHKLGLVITDEQHRFGVEQRKTFSEKGIEPHMLVMSATPIPRTLAVAVYGDMAISVIDEMPKARRPIKTCVVGTEYRPTAFKFIKDRVGEGRQVYIVCPMIEASEGLEAENVLDYINRVKKELPGIPAAVLHGRMSAEEKDNVMKAFSEGSISILVATTVIEVGVDVPNAVVMMVENAERFGLATLHQLRGRVGRGSEQSYCIYIAGMMTDAIRERLDILNKSHDGLEIARKDYELRGPGDLLGIRQSGETLFKAADIFRDEEVLKMAGDAATALLTDDPHLFGEEWQELSKRLDRYLKEETTGIIL